MQFAAHNLIGDFRTFGPVGPAYQVLGASEVSSKSSQEGDLMLRVQVLDTGELADIPARQIALDPKAV
jgi:Family of unknown function (DUF5397)